MTKKSSKTIKAAAGSKMNRERRLKAEDFDEIDDFAAQRERVELEDSEEVDSDDEYAHFDEEAILNVHDAQDFESDEDNEEEDAPRSKVTSKKDKLAALRSKSAEKGQKEKQRINRLAAKTEDSDDDILYDRLNRDESDDEDNAAAIWGKNRKNYYAEADESADAVEEEAQEARRLQKKKLSALKFDDFIDDEAATEKSSGFSRTTSKSTSQKKTLQFDDLDEFEEVESDQDSLESSEEIGEEDMGEFLALLKDFKERLHLLRNQLQPLLQRAKENKLPTSSGLSFLQLKYHLMLGYCSSVVFYLMLKGRGGHVQGHPVIRKMLRYRLMLEKIRPLEIKMRFQIEKLLLPQQNDESRFRPNPDAMENDGEGLTASQNEDEEADGKYRAPKLAPVFYNDDGKEAAKTKMEEERRFRAANKSRLLSELRGELDDAPEEESIDPVRMASRVANDHRATAREAYEEENFTRFQVSKKEKRRMETAAKPLDELDDLDEFFGELEEINETATGRNKNNKKTKKSESIAAYLDQINGDHEDVAPAASANAKYHGSDESDIEDDLHESRPSRSDQKQQKRQEKLASKRDSRGPVSYRPIADLPSSAPRPASYNMIKNKGLTPSRSKEQRNPRVKQRTRYEKAVKKLSSARGGKLTADTSKPYAGESTGIRTNLTKSVRFK